MVGSSISRYPSSISRYWRVVTASLLSCFFSVAYLGVASGSGVSSGGASVSAGAGVGSAAVGSMVGCMGSSVGSGSGGQVTSGPDGLVTGCTSEERVTSPSTRGPSVWLWSIVPRTRVLTASAVAASPVDRQLETQRIINRITSIKKTAASNSNRRRPLPESRLILSPTSSKKSNI